METSINIDKVSLSSKFGKIAKKKLCFICKLMSMAYHYFSVTKLSPKIFVCQPSKVADITSRSKAALKFPGPPLTSYKNAVFSNILDNVYSRLLPVNL